MGVLFLAKNITKPSVLWMRRMLEGLGEDVAVLASRSEVGPEYRSRFETLPLGGSSRWRKALKFTGVSKQSFSAATAKLEKAINRADVDCVLVQYADEAVRFRSVWKKVNKPVFVHCHGADVTWSGRNQHDGGARPIPVDYIEQIKELSESVRFIANSRETASRLEKIGVSGDNIQIKYLGVEVPDRCPTKSTRSSRASILYLGNLVDVKGPDLTLRAFERACELGLGGNLVVAGGGPLWITCELIRARSPYGNRIELLGPVDAEVGRRLREEADIFTAHNCRGPVSEQEEAFGVSMVEAMAAALPIVTGRSGSLPEIMTDGEQGFLVEPGNVEAHARAFLRLEQDSALRERMGNSGWRLARERYTAAGEIEQLRAILGISRVPS